MDQNPTTAIRIVKKISPIVFLVFVAVIFFSTVTYASGPDEIIDITKELQEVTKKQNISLVKIKRAVKNVEGQSGLATLLVGNSLGTLKFQLVQMRDQSVQLKSLALKTKNDEYKTQIESQVKSLKEQQTKIENFISEKERDFTIFGWFVRLL